MLTFLLLAGCTAGNPSSDSPVATSSLSSFSSSIPPKAVKLTEPKTLEQLPSELSIDHFSKMQLTGTGLTLEKIVDDNAAYTRYNISYLSNGLRITGIMNIPKGTGPFPLLIFNHGYIDPAMYTQGRGLKREQDYMAKAGFAVLHTDYRGHAGSDKSPMDEKAKIYDGGLEYAMDSVNAIHAVRAANLPTVNASRVGMLGHSMGGGVTLSILTALPELVDAAVLYAPVNADMWENFYRWRRERDEGDRTMEVFGTRAENPEKWDALSPKTFLKNITTPIYLFQGARDKDVPKEWSDSLNAQLKELSKDITYIEYPLEAHEFGSEWSDSMQKSAAFYRESLAK